MYEPVTWVFEEQKDNLVMFTKYVCQKKMMTKKVGFLAAVYKEQKLKLRLTFIVNVRDCNRVEF